MKKFFVVLVVLLAAYVLGASPCARPVSERNSINRPAST